MKALIFADYQKGQGRLATLHSAIPGGGGGESGGPPPDPADPGDPAGGGGGGSVGDSSALDASSIVTYTPRTHPVALGANVLLPRSFNTTAVETLTYARDETLALTGNASTDMAVLNAWLVTFAATDGHTRIAIPMGAQLLGSILLLPHSFPGSKTVIRAATDPSAEGFRATPANMVNAPVVTNVGNDTNGVECRPGADNYRITGLKFVPVTTGGLVYYTVHLHARQPGQNDEDVQNVLSACPTDIVLDRILVTGPAASDGRNKNGVSLNGIRLSLVDSWITGAYNDFDETHGIITYNGPGPYKVVGNYCDAGSVPYFVGGTAVAMGAQVGRPADIECRRNFFSHPLAWNPAVNGGANKYGMKGLVEFKNARYVLAEGNVLFRCPNGAQTGMAWVVKSAGDGMGASTGLGTSHVTIRYNTTSNVRHALAVAGYGDPIEFAIEPCHHVAVYHNLFFNVGSVDGGVGVLDGSGNAVILINPTDYLKIRFNTFVHNVVQQGVFFVVDAVPIEDQAIGLDVSDNVFTSNSNSGSIHYSGIGEGQPALLRYCPDATWTRNLVVGLEAQYALNLPQGNGNVYPDAGVLPTLAAVIAQVGFVDAAGGDYRLAPSSPGKSKGLNGADPGCNMDDVELATSSVQ